MCSRRRQALRPLTKSFLTLVGGLLLIPVPGRADTFTFNDLTEAMISVTQVGSSDSFSSQICTFEEWEVAVLSSDPNATIRSVSGSNIFVSESDGVNISDQLGLGLIVNTNSIDIGYITSISSDPNPGTCASAFVLCSIIEN